MWIDSTEGTQVADRNPFHLAAWRPPGQLKGRAAAKREPCAWRS